VGRRVLIAILLCCGGLAHAQQVDFSLSVSPLAGKMDDDYWATIQLTIHGVNNPEKFTLPDFADWTIVAKGRSPSTQWVYTPRGQEIINQDVMRFQLRPKHGGKLKVGAAKMRLDGKDYETKPVEVAVAETGAPNVPGIGPTEAGSNGLPDEAQLDQGTFIFASVDKTKVTQGEQVTVTWNLYMQDQILQLDPKPPKLDGVWFESLYEAQKLTYQKQFIGSREVTFATLSKRAIFPTKAGKVTIPPYGADLSTFNTAFGEPLHLESRPVDLDVAPLPPGAPAGFDPAYVGTYSLEAAVDRDQVPAGESTTLSLTVHGTGAIRRAKVPALSVDGFQILPPHDFDEHLDTSTGVVKGDRVYKYVLTPTRGGRLAIGPIEIPYFDPVSGKYAIARADSIPITVLGDPSTVVGKIGPGGTSAENVISRDIRPTIDVPHLSSRLVARFYRSRVFVGALAAPGAIFLFVILGDKLRERLRRETPRARLRRARGRARKRLRIAELHIRGNRAAKFFGEIARVLTEHIEERVGEPVSAMTRDRLHDLLVARNFPAETVEAIVRELENCDFARFAPSASGPGEMRAAMRRVRALLTAIERVRPMKATEGEVAA
jgi:hypothetical protein